MAPGFTRILLALAAALFLVAPAGRSSATPPPAAVEYTVLLSGHPAGGLVVWSAGPNSRSTFFTYTDRGRGPQLNSTTVVGGDLLPATFDVSGVDYLKAPVEESFARENGVATWRSAADAGTTPAHGYYLPNQANSEDLAGLARALLLAPNHELDLIPAGHVRIETSGGLAVRYEFTTPGPQPKPLDATLYLIDGLGFSPLPIWLDQDRQLVFEGSTWLGTVRTDWEAKAPDLVKRQDAVLAQRAREQAKVLADKPDVPVAFIHVNVFDAETKTLKRDQTVVIEGDRITAVGPAAKVRYK